MKYMGSKNRISKYILPFIQESLGDREVYIEPFVGGANMIDKVKARIRMGNDSNKFVIALLREVSRGWIPSKINKEEYLKIKNNYNNYSAEEVGFAGICASYSGKWFGGYAGVVKTKGGVRDYQEEAIKNLLKQRDSLKNIIFRSNDYSDLGIPTIEDNQGVTSDFIDKFTPANTVIYCDPPYANTTKYKDNFNHEEFWKICDGWIQQGYKVFVSEYNAPSDWKCIWEKEVKSSLSANGKSGGNKLSVERLFTK